MPTEDPPQGTTQPPDDTQNDSHGAGSFGPAESVTREPPVFYRINPRAISYSEFRQGGKRSTALTAWLAVHVLRLKLPVSSDDPAVESLAPFEVREDRLPEAVRRVFAHEAKNLESVGFHSPVFHAIDDALHTTDTFLVTFAHSTLPVAAKLHLRYWRTAGNDPRSAFTEFITAYPDGTFLWTVSSRVDLLTPPSCTVTRKFNAPPLELWKLHAEAMNKRGTAGALGAQGRTEALEICERHHASVTAFHLGRGLFEVRTAEDDARAEANRQSRVAAAAAGSKHPQVLAELVRLQTKKASWVTSLVVLAATLGIFLAVGLPGQRSFLGLLALVPILLFHELGHYAAMRAYGYRNLRMFFIPGFGAAVSGRAFNVPEWKRAVVALAGPVPGLILGIIVGLCGIVARSNFAIDAAFLMVLLNGFNLLPMMPLDGGRVLHAVLFSRHYLLDATFRGVAALSILALAVVLKGNVFIGVGVFLLMGIPIALKQARTGADLKRQGFPAASANDQLVPVGAAERIIDRLRADAKGKLVAPKVLAQQTLDIYESINTRPTGWLSGIGLMSVYTLCLAAAVVFTFVFAVARQGKLQQFLSGGSNAPTHALAPESIRATPAPAAIGAAGATGSAAYGTVVATFPGGKGVEAYERATKKLGPGESGALLGDTVMIRFAGADDEARKRWMAELAPGAADAFVDGTTLHAAFSFQCVAPTEAAAEAVETELADFFALPTDQGLVPPWAGGAVTPEQTLARSTYRRMTHADVHNDARMQELRRNLEEARKHGDQTQSKALFERQRTLLKELLLGELKRIAEDKSGAVDQALAQQYLEMYQSAGSDEFFKEVGPALGPRMGQATPGDRATCARSGWAYRTGQVVRVSYVEFEDPARGAAALAAWLRAKNCRSIRYDVRGESTEEQEDPDE